MYFYNSSTLAQHTNTRHALEAVHYSCFYSQIQIKSRFVLAWPFMVMGSPTADTSFYERVIICFNVLVSSPISSWHMAITSFLINVSLHTVKNPASELVRPSKVMNLTSSILVWPSIISASFNISRHVIYVWSSDRKALPSMLELYLCVTIWSKTHPAYPGIGINHCSFRATSPALTLNGKYS